MNKFQMVLYSSEHIYILRGHRVCKKIVMTSLTKICLSFYTGFPILFCSLKVFLTKQNVNKLYKVIKYNQKSYYKITAKNFTAID